MVEQRKNQRFELSLPVRILRNGAGIVSYTATTRNISSCGVLFASDADLQISDSIEYVVTLTDMHGITVDLRCIGKVVRRQESSSDTHSQLIAATLDRYEFIRRAA